MTTSLDDLLIGAAVLLPLFAGLFGLLPRTRRFVEGCVPASAAAGLAAALFVSGPSLIELPWAVLGVQFGLDETGRTFLFFSSVLWILAGFYGLGYLRGQPRLWLYHVFYLFAMTGNFGLILARDAVTFYVFFALMSFAAYGLVIHNRDDVARRAGRIYLILAVAGEVAIFAGLVGLIGKWGMNVQLPVAGSLDGSTPGLALLTVGFGIKAGMPVLHVWLPLAHPAAPAPASAVLSGAMIKAGLLGWLRFLPLGQDGFGSWGIFFMIVGLTGVFFGVVIGLMQTVPKTILAYSSISQMGFMTLGVGAGLLEPALWPGLLVAVGVYAMHHGLSKGALFLSTGIARGGMSWISWSGIVISALALAGAPLTSGAAAKSALKVSSHELPGPWPTVLGVLFPAAAIGTGLLMARFIVVLRDEKDPGSHPHEGRCWMTSAWAALVVLSVAMIWIQEPGAGFARMVLTPGKLLKAAWPVLAAATAGWLVFQWRPGFLRRWIGRVAPGDLVIPAEAVLHSLAKTRIPDLSRAPDMAGERIQQQAAKASGRADRLETRLGAWKRFVLAMIGLALLLYVLSMAIAT